MDSQLEEQPEEKKNPLRMFIPLEVPSQRSQPINDNSLVVSIRSTREKVVVKRPGPFLCERRTLPHHIQAAMASGPKSYSNLVYVVHDSGYPPQEMTPAEQKLG